MTDSLFTFGSYAPLIVGSIFFALGINFILHFLRFRKMAERVIGHVKLIEKYIGYSKSASSNGTTATTYFRPVVEYLYNDETRTTVGLSVSQLRHAPGQKVNVLLNVSQDQTQIQAKVDDPLTFLLGGIFSLAGFIAVCVFIFGIGGSAILAVILTSTLTAIGYCISGMMLNFNVAFEDHHDQWVRKEGSTLIETKEDYRKIVSSHNLIAMIMGLILLVAGIAIMNYGYSEFSENTANMLFTDFQSLWNQIKDGHLSSNDEKAAILFGIGTFMFLVSLRPIYIASIKSRAIFSI